MASTVATICSAEPSRGRDTECISHGGKELAQAPSTLRHPVKTKNMGSPKRNPVFFVNILQITDCHTSQKEDTMHKIKIRTLAKDGTIRTFEAESLHLEDGAFVSDGLELRIDKYHTIEMTSECGFFKVRIEGKDPNIEGRKVELVDSSMGKVFTDDNYPGKLYVQEPADDRGWFMDLKNITRIEMSGPKKWKVPELR